jgi:hypothetical protein
MISSDEFFILYHSDFPPKTRNKARTLFRRAIREFYVMQRKYVIEPDSGKRVQSIFIGKVIQCQKAQRRIVRRLFKGQTSAGRPKKPEIKLLLARLFILWGRYAKSPSTLSRMCKNAIATDFENFLLELLPKLGAKDVRRYVEAHWRERK